MGNSAQEWLTKLKKQAEQIESLREKDAESTARIEELIADLKDEHVKTEALRVDITNLHSELNAWVRLNEDNNAEVKRLTDENAELGEASIINRLKVNELRRLVEIAQRIIDEENKDELKNYARLLREGGK